MTDYGYIGKDMRIPILELEKKIRRCQRGLGNKTNRGKHKLKDKKRLNLKIRRYYKKIHNIVKELHNQAALYLCKNYERILIPKFETQKMVKNMNTFKRERDVWLLRKNVNQKLKN
jgi:transposase